MKFKKIVALAMASMLLLSTSLVGFGESIDLGYSQMLSEKMASMSEAQKNKYVEMLKVTLYDQYTIEATINSIDSMFTAEEKAALERNGISNSFIISSLRSLATWPIQDRFALIDAIRTNNQEQIENLNAYNSGSSSGGTGGSTGGNSGGNTGGTSGGASGGQSSGGSTGGVTTPEVPTTAPTTPSVPTGQGNVAITDSQLDQVLNSNEFKELLNIADENTALGAVTTIAKDSAVYTIRQSIAKSAFNLPEEIKNIDSLVKVTTPKATALRLDLYNMMVKVFADAKEVTAKTKLQTFTDVKNSKASQLNVSFLAANKLIVKDSKGNIGVATKLTKKEAATFIVSFMKTMGVEIKADPKKTALLKDVSGLKQGEKDAIAKLYAIGLLTVDKNGKVSPNTILTQSDLSALIKNLYTYYSKNYPK